MASPTIDFPSSNNTVDVRLVDTTAVLTARAESFIEPVQEGHEVLNITCAAFLLHHESSGKRIMFDLGVRKDYWNLSATIQKRLGDVIPSLKVDRDTTEVLTEKGVPLDSISSVIWSHYHWDHTGNMSLFPPSTELIVGPGFKGSPLLLPGFPENPDSPVCSSDVNGRSLREVDFEDSDLQIGGFAACDFFGDGSFYLLNTPGHCLGHMCGLARTTPGDESTFLLLGGDICHFAGDIRPNASYPLPDEIPASVLDHDPDYFPVPCPCSFFTAHHPVLSREGRNDGRRTTPFFKVSTHPKSSYVDPPTAQKSVDKLIDFESCPRVFVCLAHDPTLFQYLPTLNEDPESTLNDWQSQGWKDKCRWDWLNELPRNGRQGRKPIVEGFWRDGKPWDRPAAG
ncbi:Gamma-lactamase MBL1 [Exophiala dermatitidis]|uniref:Metallo-beta-lactamase domain-containing protein n=1 Tax=Exophiala dermatitidis (strain ATCC 34100 / CBS 525.76 / NIH/UT8656) TaxID=858893 RepID=H6BYF8_EXODN|nr:uncharacterized protein HMPREF1120_05569 [Exophiala dermatitidis NIH/UT8656]EHY57538.1 hypothetical protein HMPREF1120_05569 [Exophiala dermatitidis NIH/UT8656]